MFSLAKFAMLVFVAFVSSGCTLFSPCGNSVLQRTKSPDGSYQAFVFLRDCGATSDFSTQVSVLPTGNSLPNNDQAHPPPEAQ